MGFSIKIKNILKKSDALVYLNKNFIKQTRLNLVATFPAFAPNSAGSYKNMSEITVQSVNQFIPFLRNLAKSVHGGEIALQNVDALDEDNDTAEAVKGLKLLFDRYGSDKANYHNYHKVYARILLDRNNIANVFEIGLGTNNTDVVSTMGSGGKPGASLRAFRDFCPNAQVCGADIDRRILFEEDRIKTFFVDQTNPVTFDRLSAQIPGEFDLVIDDGLHSPNANILSLQFALKLIKKGGWAVVEDIAADAESLWYTVAAMLPAQYESHLYQADGGLLFAVQRLA